MLFSICQDLDPSLPQSTQITQTLYPKEKIHLRNVPTVFTLNNCLVLPSQLLEQRTCEHGSIEFDPPLAIYHFSATRTQKILLAIGMKCIQTLINFDGILSTFLPLRSILSMDLTQSAEPETQRVATESLFIFTHATVQWRIVPFTIAMVIF